MVMYVLKEILIRNSVLGCQHDTAVYSVSEPNSIPFRLPFPRFDGEDQQQLAGCGVSMDSEYNVLWTFSPSSGKVSCFNPIAADIEGKPGGREL